MKILIKLLERAQSYGSIVEYLNLKKTAVSNHLSQLIEAKLIEKSDYGIYNIDATSIALNIFKKDIVNTAMIGAFSKITGLVTLDSIFEGIEQRFEGNKDLIELNKKVIKEAYENVKWERRNA